MAAFPYESPVAPESLNIDSGRLAKVIRRFRGQQRSGQFPGGQLVLRRNGKLVLNEAIGVARGFRSSEQVPQIQVGPQRPFPVLSAGKPLAAVVVAMLEDRGALDVNAPIAQIFPAFARHGKERITTLDVLTHRSGMLMPELMKEPDLWGNREAIQQALIETVPSYPRGTLAYHPYEYGWLLSEIVMRVDGRNLPDFFADEIAMPLQLPALRFGLAGRSTDRLGFSYWLGKDKVMVAGTNVAEDFESQNSEQFLEARNPATSLVTDAASLAAFYDFLLAGGKTPAGEQLISEGTIRQYTARHVLSWDRSLGTVMAVGRGFVVGTCFPSSFGWWNTNQCFGHAGGFSSLAFGDLATGISVAIVTNGNRSLGDFTRRFVPLAHGLRRSCR
ncbi:MAG: serine hydrolase domain-containing protein [Anaerolineales bacterium]